MSTTPNPNPTSPSHQPRPFGTLRPEDHLAWLAEHVPGGWTADDQQLWEFVHDRADLSPDRIIREWVLSDAEPMTLEQVYERIGKLLDHHDRVARVVVTLRGKRGAGRMDVYGEDAETLIAYVTISHDGEIEALPAEGF